MKVAITGHTYGIGQALYAHLMSAGHQCVGFSRTTGHNINDRTSRGSIVQQSHHCDMFINCAYSGFGQTHLLIDLYRRWHNLEKTIINIGSRVTEVVLPPARHDLLNYQAEKLSLKLMCEKLSGNTCRVKYTSFGYVGTPRILERYPHFTPQDYITLEGAVKIILESSA
jgi:nucleoside-diphosphate-sugar epimerase